MYNACRRNTNHDVLIRNRVVASANSSRRRRHGVGQDTYG
jgi:hypothetical protein